MALPFVSYEDTRMRLHRTVCMYDSVPMLVECTDEKDSITLYPLRQKRATEKAIRTKITDEKFSYKSPPLGYANVSKQAVYVMRRPSRQTSAGLNINNIICEPYINAEYFMYSKAFEDCILGNHPSIDVAVAQFAKDPEVRSAAVHRNLAISRDMNVWYRMQHVGRYVPAQKAFEIQEGPQASFIHRIIDGMRLFS